MNQTLKAQLEAIVSIASLVGYHERRAEEASEAGDEVASKFELVNVAKYEERVEILLEAIKEEVKK